MSIILTSFHRSMRYFGQKFAICDRQPAEYNFEELLFFAPRNGFDEPLRSTDYFRRPKGGYDAHVFYAAVEDYRRELMAGYCNHLDEIRYFLKALSPSDDLVLCCWCPHSNSARQQIKDLGVMACHSGVVAEILSSCRPDLTVILDVDRSEKLVPQWQHGKFEEMTLYPREMPSVSLY